MTSKTKAALLTVLVMGPILLTSVLFVVIKDGVPILNDSNTPCTQETKLCPDGNTAVRQGKNCDFTECPVAIQSETPSQSQVANSKYKLDGSLISYRTTRGAYPEGSTEGWSDFLEFSKKRPITSPFTGRTYAYTSLAPLPGEIQYMSPGSCDYATNELTIPRTADSYAFRIYYPDGKILCSATL